MEPMRAAVMFAPHELRVEGWEAPDAGEDDVLVRVEATGVCAGDMYHYLGKNPYAPYPQVCGHEIAGVVEAGGGFAAGQRVVIEPYIGCGECYPCRIGKYNCCSRLQIVGVHRQGGFAEYVVAPASHVHAVPDGIDAVTASFAEPVAIAVQATRRAAVSEGETVLLLGAGPIGLAIIEVARARGAEVLVTDVLPERLEVAASLGAEPLAPGDALTAEIRARTDGEGAPVVIEATGNPQAIEQTVELVAPGGRIVVVGLARQGVGVTLPGLDLTRKEVTLLGSRAAANAFPESLRLLAEGLISYPRVATTYGMWEAPDVFAHLAAEPGSVQKAVLVVGESPAAG